MMVIMRLMQSHFTSYSFYFRMKHVLILVIILQHMLLVVSTTLIGIDFGSEYIKIAAMKPGKPMDIALNREAQRKTPTVVAFKNGERHIGDSALSIATKHPQQTFLHIPLLLGRQLNSPIVKLYLARYPHHRLVIGVDGTLAFLLDDNHQISVEQLAAMLLEAAMETALTFLDEHAAQMILTATGSADRSEIEVALTTPPFWGQSERHALLRAAQYAGISNVRLINSNAAVAMNFGSGIGAALTEKFTIFDMGATLTVVTLVTYRRVLGLRNNTLRMLRIDNVGYDATLGAINFIDRLAGLNGTVANGTSAVKNTKSISREDKSGFSNPKFKSNIAKPVSKDAKTVANDATSVAKARQAASRLFRVLSANRQVGSMTRDYLRVLVTDLLGRLRRVVEMAVRGGTNLGEEILLMGGGSRCPLVQEELLNVTGRSKLGHSVNTDEAAALGAVQHLLSIASRERAISSGRRQTAAPLLLVDVNLFPVFVFTNMTEPKSAPQSHQLFNFGDPIPQTKSILFDVNQSVNGEDFYIALEYKNLTNLNKFHQRSLGKSLLVKYQTVDFIRLLNKFRSVNSVSTTRNRMSSDNSKVFIQLEAVFRYDSNGLISLETLDLVLSGAEKPTGSKKRESMNFRPVEFGFPMPLEAQRQVAQAVVREFRQRDEALRAASLSRNNLEEAVIHARSRLLASSSSSNSPDNKSRSQSAITPVYVLCSNPKERRILFAALVSAERLLASSTVNATLLDEELKKFKSAFSAAAERADELKKRSIAMAKLNSTISKAKLFVKPGSESLPLLTAIRNVQNWYLKAKFALDRLDLTRDPPILSSQIDTRRTILEQLMVARQRRGKHPNGRRLAKRINSKKSNGQDGAAQKRLLDDEIEVGNADKQREQPPKPDEMEYRDEENDREPDDDQEHELHSPNYEDL